VKRRWKVLLGTGGILLVAALAPIVTIETACRSPIAGLDTAGYTPLLKDPAWRRDESRTWLTYPEWHIVYSAESFAAHLRHAPPSSYHYLRDIRSFWSGYCAMNQAAAGRAGVDARVMLYTIGLSYSAELLVKALYENTLGRVSEYPEGETRLATFRNPLVMPTDGKTADTACWVRRVAGEQFQVFAVNCAHLGCPVRWFPQSGLFMCPCHGGAYYRDGSRASGPPERGLFEYPYKVENGLVTIHAGEMPTPGASVSCDKERRCA